MDLSRAVDVPPWQTLGTVLGQPCGSGHALPAVALQAGLPMSTSTPVSWAGRSGGTSWSEALARQDLDTDTGVARLARLGSGSPASLSEMVPAPPPSASSPGSAQACPLPGVLPWSGWAWNEAVGRFNSGVGRGANPAVQTPHANRCPLRVSLLSSWRVHFRVKAGPACGQQGWSERAGVVQLWLWGAQGEALNLLATGVMGEQSQPLGQAGASTSVPTQLLDAVNVHPAVRCGSSFLF